MGMAIANGATPERLRVLILTGQSDLPYHDWRVSTPFLRTALTNTGRFDVKVIEEARGLTARSLAGYDVLILNYNGPRWGRETESAIEEFVRSGKGLVSFHGVTYGQFYGQEFQQHWKASSSGDKGWAGYPNLIGASWEPAKIGHGARHVFPVKWLDRDHPVSRGLAETFLANDELYHRIDLRPDAKVLATAYSAPETGGTGKDEPIIWTVAYGKGRTFHMTLGHDLSAMSQPGFMTAFARGTEWAATGSVTLPTGIRANPKPKADAVRVLVVTGGHAYPTSFYTLFEGYDDIVWRHATTQHEAFTPNMKNRYDVVLLHDMGETIGDTEKASLQAFVEAGKGVVAVHHSIVDYTSWPWWYEEVIGGKYFNAAIDSHPKSAYKEGLELVANPVKTMANHPVIRGVGPLVMEDEAYSGMWHAPGIQVLMEEDHPLSDKPVVWLGPHPHVIYIQPGHSESTHRNPAYRKLVHNAILWSAGKLQ
jgi:type 1 glutamine amidotransferase